jgi:hypothetical protein
MKCKFKVGELREALQTATITMDRRAGSEYGYVYLGAKRNKAGGNQRMLLNSTDGIRRFLLKVAGEVEEPGDLVIDPIRLSTLLDKVGDEEMVTFTPDKIVNRTMVRCGSARVVLMSSGKPLAFDLAIKSFPAPDTKPTFLIESANLKSLLDRTQAFIYRKDGREAMKTLMIRTIAGGYEAFATNSECIAKAQVVDANSSGLDAAGLPVRLLEIPLGALAPLTKMLSRNKKETVQVVIVKSPEGKDAAAYFRAEQAFFGTNLVSSVQPAMDAIFKSQAMTMSVEIATDSLLTSISRSSPFCSETVAGRLISIAVKDSILRLSAKDNYGDFEEELVTTAPAAGTGDTSFRVDFLSAALRSSETPTVLLKMGTSGGAANPRPSAMLVSGDTSGSTYVIGCVQIKDAMQQAA